MDPVINLGFISIHIYSICLFIAILLGSNLVIREAKRHGISENFIINLLFFGIVFGIVGARIYFVIFNWDYYSDNVLDIFKVWEGGLAIHGGIIAALICILIICHNNKVNSLKVLDYIVVGVIIGQAIGRWGNFFNGEAHGPETTLSYLQSLPIPDFIIDGMHIGGTYYIPTFLYESVWCLIGFVIMILIRHRKFMKVGFLTSFYLMWYSFERFFVEGLRTDSLMFGPIKMAQVVSVIMFVSGICLFIWCLFKSKKYNEEAKKCEKSSA